MKRKSIKFLADANIEKPLVDFLARKGFDVKWVGEADNRVQDIEICKMANAERRIILTNDKDFGEICFFQKRVSQGIILLRVKGQNSFDKITLLEKLLESYSEKINGHFVVVKKRKFRFIPLEVI